MAFAMPDPRVLYAVTTVVVLALASWVVAVLLRAPKQQTRAGVGGAPVPDGPLPVGDAAKPARPAEMRPLPSELPKLHSGDLSDASASIRVPVELEEDDAPTGPLPLILVTAVGRTDPGLKRTHNEDAYAILEDHHLFVIADGMGRHAAGEVASKLCVDAITEAFHTSSFGKPRAPALPRRASRLRGSIFLANERVYRESQANAAYTGMGTTVVGAYFSPNNQSVCIAHVGDSRCYRLRAGELTQLTADHTLGAAGIQGKTAALLSRAVGIEPNVDVDVSIEAPLPGDVYLLCSDGLSRMVQDSEIKDTLESAASLDEATRILIEKANARGGRDNITTILVRVDAMRPKR
jgi:protein phosphatase